MQVQLLRVGSAIGGGLLGFYQCNSDPKRADPIFRFGVIADIQYCDVAPATNFRGTETRDYRGVIAQTERAVRLWNSLDSLAFVAQLGDLIDGQNAGKYGAGLDFDAPQSAKAMDLVTGILAGCKVPIFHAIGNHEL